jgi:thymidylate synthase (FAD)
MRDENDSTLHRVLDHGLLRLVDNMGGDLSIVRAARVSYRADWRSGDDVAGDRKLIRYMLEHGHTSPFEHVVFTFEIKCPIFVARQWHRHRTWSYNEISGRYSVLPEEFYVPDLERVLFQSTTNKQGSERTEEWNEQWAAVQREFIESDCRNAFDTYRALVDAGVARETARMVLPLSTYTRYFGTVDLHNLFGFLKQRMDPHAQYEIRVYAEAIFDLITDRVYDTCKIWTELQTGALREALEKIWQDRSIRFEL